MRPVSKWIVGAALAALVVVGGAARTFEGPRIAVVDMSRLVSTHKKSRDEQALIDQWRAANQQLLDERAKEYRAQVAELDSLQPGSDGYLKKGKELRVRKFELEAEQDSLQDEFERRVARSLSDGHARVAAACKTYLESRDLDAVLQYASSPVKGTKSSEVIPEIVVRSVVAFRGSVDATDAVLAILDAGK
ncbi:MAG: OmpH family outer membrane protein [Planctomycetes bacterium]|nr:OmpH family outer membrane protein [Planctomycetota bacterium]